MQSDYKLSFLPIFFEDLYEAIYYIKDVKKNPDAAERLSHSIEEAILRRLPIAESFESYQSKVARRSVYYRIYVDNYIVFYTVLEDDFGGKTMEVRRLIYKRRNMEKLI